VHRRRTSFGISAERVGDRGQGGETAPACKRGDGMERARNARPHRTAFRVETREPFLATFAFRMRAPPLTPKERAERRVGTSLLKWKIDAFLGVGGMAAVYAATHHNRSRVALKVLHRELAASPELQQRFLHEAYVANSVGHEGAVQVLDDHVSADGEPFLVMQLLEGQSLDALQMARGTLPVDEVLDCADQVLDVLAAAHARAIVHRDIKPQNIFWTRSGAVKVLDFGVARILDGAPSLTATGVLIGTPAYMPPEQASGRTADIGPTSDLWSVGATMFTLLTNRFVHEADNAQAHTVKAAVAQARSVRTLRPDLPEMVVRLVDRALAFDIKDRWPSALEMQLEVRRVRALAASGGAPVVPEGGPRDNRGVGHAPPPANARASSPAIVAAAEGVEIDSGAETSPLRGSGNGRGPLESAPFIGERASAPFIGERASAPFIGERASAPFIGERASAPLRGAPVFGAPPVGAPSSKDPANVHSVSPARLTPLQLGLFFGAAFAIVVALMFVLRTVLAPADASASGSGSAATSGASGAAGTTTPLPSGTTSVAPEPLLPRPLPPASAAAAPGELNPAEAHTALDAAELELKKCSSLAGPKGRVSVDVTFYPNGGVDARVELRFSGTSVGQCVEEAFRKRARVTPFQGRAVATTRMVVVRE